MALSGSGCRSPARRSHRCGDLGNAGKSRLARRMPTPGLCPRARVAVGLISTDRNPARTSLLTDPSLVGPNRIDGLGLGTGSRRCIASLVFAILSRSASQSPGNAIYDCSSSPVHFSNDTDDRSCRHKSGTGAAAMVVVGRGARGLVPERAASRGYPPPRRLGTMVTTSGTSHNKAKAAT